MVKRFLKKQTQTTAHSQTPSVLSAVRVHATCWVSMMTCTVSRSAFCRNTVMTTPISISRLIMIFLYSVISPCCPLEAISAADPGLLMLWKNYIITCYCILLLTPSTTAQLCDLILWKSSVKSNLKKVLNLYILWLYEPAIYWHVYRCVQNKHKPIPVSLKLLYNIPCDFQGMNTLQPPPTGMASEQHIIQPLLTHSS